MDRYSPKKYTSSSSTHANNNEYRARRASPCYASSASTGRSLSPPSDRTRSPSNHKYNSHPNYNRHNSYSNTNGKDRRDRLKSSVHSAHERSRERSNVDDRLGSDRHYERMNNARSLERLHDRSMDRHNRDRSVERMHDRFESSHRSDSRNPLEQRDRKDREKEYYSGYNDYHKDYHKEQRSRSRERDSMKRLHHDLPRDYREKEYRKDSAGPVSGGQSGNRGMKKDSNDSYSKIDSNREKIYATDGGEKERRYADWTECVSSSGKRYYYNQRTGVSQWEKPEEWMNASTSSSHHYDKSDSALSSRKEDSKSSGNYYHHHSQHHKRSSGKDDLHDYRRGVDGENSSSHSSGSNHQQQQHQSAHSNQHADHYLSRSTNNSHRHNRYDSYDDKPRWTSKGDDSTSSLSHHQSHSHHPSSHSHSQSHHHHHHHSHPRSSHESSQNLPGVRTDTKRHRSDSGESGSSGDKNHSHHHSHHHHSHPSSHHHHHSHLHESTHNGATGSSSGPCTRGNGENDKPEKVSAVTLLQSLNSQELLSPSQTSLSNLSKLIAQFTSMYGLPDLNELPPQEALRTLQQALALTTQAKKQHSSGSKAVVGTTNPVVTTGDRTQSSISTPLLCSVGESPSSGSTGHALTRQQQNALKEHLSQYLRSHQLQQQHTTTNYSSRPHADVVGQLHSADGIRHELDNLLVGKGSWAQSPGSECSDNSDVHSEGSSVTSALSLDDQSNTKNTAPTLTPALSKYFDERLISHVLGWQTEQLEKQANRCMEEAHNIGSLNATRVSAELKMARSLVRLTEIQATLQEQR